MMNKEIMKMKRRYEALYPHDGIDNKALLEIERKLAITLPKSFCAIATFFSGGSLGNISNHSFASVNNSLNIIDETIRLRKTLNLPMNVIVLAEPPESLIVLDTKNIPSVIWFDALDISRIEEKSFITKPDEWDSYADYFKELLEEEEDNLIHFKKIE